MSTTKTKYEEGFAVGGRAVTASVAILPLLLLTLLCTPALLAQPGELPRPDASPGAVRVRGWPHVPPGCPLDLVPGQRPAGGCPGPITADELCATHGTKQYRHTAGVSKPSVCASYGIPRSECPLYEDDHLIPLTLGGSDDRLNHWPEPWGAEWDAGRKDWLEVELRRLVCERRVLSLERAWRCVAEEWTKCYVQAKAGDYGHMGVE